jgi:hypothetical protein
MAHLLLTNCQSNMARVAGQTSQASHLPCLCAAGSRTPTAFPGRCKLQRIFSKAGMQAKREDFTWRAYSWRQATARPESLQIGRAAPSACTSCLCNKASCATLLAAHIASKLPHTLVQFSNSLAWKSKVRLVTRPCMHRTHTHTAGGRPPPPACSPRASISSSCTPRKQDTSDIAARDATFALRSPMEIFREPWESNHGGRNLSVWAA